MLSYTDLKPGVCVVVDGQPYQVTDSQFVRMQQRKPVMKTKLRSILTGSVQERAFQPSDKLEEAELEKEDAEFLYSRRGEFWFSEPENSKNRFMVKEDQVGRGAQYLKPNLNVVVIKFRNKIIGVELPIKAEYKVVEAPPSARGNTAQGGSKSVTIESGAKVTTPLFVSEGDTIIINTQTGEYVSRAEKK